MKHTAFCITCHRPVKASRPLPVASEDGTSFYAGWTKVDVAEAIRMHQTGSTLQEIGNLYGVTRERVRQILKPYGLVYENSGRHAKVVQREKDKRADFEKQHDERVRKYRGMSAADYDAVRKLKTADGTDASTAFMAQRRTQKDHYRREWKLTFAEWWKVWEESGHWNERGKGADKYVMWRIDRTGAFEIGNVKIAQFGPMVAQQRREECAAGTGVFKRWNSRREAIATAGNRE